MKEITIYNTLREPLKIHFFEKGFFQAIKFSKFVFFE